MVVTVYVGNLGNNTDETELKAAFEPYGEISDVWLSRRPAGFAFIDFQNEEDAQRAIAATNEQSVCGRTVRVELSRKRRDPHMRGGRPRGGDPTAPTAPTAYERSRDGGREIMFRDRAPRRSSRSRSRDRRDPYDDRAPPRWREREREREYAMGYGRDRYDDYDRVVRERERDLYAPRHRDSSRERDRGGYGAVPRDLLPPRERERMVRDSSRDRLRERDVVPRGRERDMLPLERERPLGDYR